MGIGSWLSGLFTTSSATASALDQRIDPFGLAMRGLFDPDRLPDWQLQRQPNWVAWDTEAVRSDAVRKSVIVFACATYLADAVAEATLVVERQAKREWEPAQDRAGQALEGLLTHPNPHMSEPEFLQLLVMQMAIQGYAVAEKVRTAAGLPVELWPLRPDWLSQRPTAEGGWTYAYAPPGRPQRIIPAEDLIFLPWRHDDRMERRGIGPVAIAAREIGIDASLTDFLKAFLDAGGIPPFVLLHPDPIYDEAIVETMQEKWRQKYGGARAYGSLPVLHGGYQLEPVGQDINAMAWPDLRGLTELKICQAFRVPPDLVYARETLKAGSLTTTELDGDMAQLQRYGAAPLRTRIAGGLGRALLPEFVGSDRSYRIAFDTSEILALQEDVDALHTRVRADWNDGLLMLDEARQELGRDELPSGQGQIFKVPFSVLLVPPAALTEAALPTAQPAATGAQLAAPPATIKALPASERRYRDLETLSGPELELRSRALQRAVRDRQRLTEIGARKLRTFFTAQGERLAASVAKAGAEPETKDITDIDWEDELHQLEQILQRFLLANGEAAFAAASQLLASDIAWDLANPRIGTLVQTLGRRIVGVHETTRRDVVAQLTEGLLAGESLPQLADRIRTLFAQTYAGRAETVARTESMMAYGQASALAYAESGEVEAVELADNPAHTERYNPLCLTCAERDRLVVPLAEVGTHLGCEHINGSLTILPVLATPLGEE